MVGIQVGTQGKKADPVPSGPTDAPVTSASANSLMVAPGANSTNSPGESVRPYSYTPLLTEIRPIELAYPHSVNKNRASAARNTLICMPGEYFHPAGSQHNLCRRLQISEQVKKYAQKA